MTSKNTSKINTKSTKYPEKFPENVSSRVIKMRGSTAGLADHLRGSSPAHYALLTILDLLFSSLVVASGIVGYWRSTWRLTSFYLYPENPVKSASCSLVIGIAGHLFFGIFQDIFTKNFNPERKRLTYYVVSRLYTAIYAFACVNSWRGAWELLDKYTDSDINTVLATTLVSVVSLGCMRALRNVSATPFGIAIDCVEGYFEVPTMFKTTSSDKTTLYVLDCLFSVFVVGTLVVFVWRGAWVLFDLFLFPNDFTKSSWTSLILGYSIAAIAFSIQPFMRWLCDRLTGFWRILVADIFLFFSVIGTVNVWRGIWNLLDIYFLPDHPELSCWTCHWACLILLILLNCSNTLLVRGVYIDCEEPAGKCVVFPCYYLRLMFKAERQKKRQIHADTIAKRNQQLECLKVNCTSDKHCNCASENHVILLQHVLEPNHVEA